VRREGIRKESERDTVVVVLLEGLYIMLRRKRKAS